MVELLGTMAEWFQRNNDKNHITNEVIRRKKKTRQSKEVMNNMKIERKTTRKMNLSLDIKLDQPRL